MSGKARLLLGLCALTVTGLLAGLVLGATLEQLLLPVLLLLIVLLLPGGDGEA